MREALFLKQNAAKWSGYEEALKGALPADELAKLFVELTDDLSYAKTFYPKSNTAKYLNGLAAQSHQKIYKNKKENRGRIWWFWQFELPILFKKYHRQFLYAFLFFLISSLMGAVSAKYDENFLRLILGDGYVNMTLDNIEHGDPFAIYKHSSQLPMFFGIAFNNIKVAFIAYVLGITFSVGTLWMLMSNGLMMGSFQYFFISKGLGTKFILVVFIHGTLELWSIIIAGAAGLIMGNSFLFPGTFTRTQSLIRGGRDGLKIVFGLVPLFFTAAFFESFITRYSNMPVWLSISILAGSTTFIIWYFVVYPTRLHSKMNGIESSPTKTISNKNFNAWITKKWNLES